MGLHHPLSPARVAAALLAALAPVLALAASVLPSTCLFLPDKAVPVHAGPGRAVYCGMDLGSRTVKLSVVSLEGGRNQSILDERQCKRTLGLGALVFDARTGTARAVPEESIRELADTVHEYQEICARDGGRLVAVGATQWARDATNTAEVRARVKAATGVEFEVIGPAQEAEYGYAAAALDAPGRLVLDPGSNSFELAWREKGAPFTRAILVAYGYVRASARDFEPAADYASARAAYQARVRQLIEEGLGALKPPVSLAGLRERVRTGALGPELLALGQDGVVELAVRGRLRNGEGWVTDAEAYEAILRGQALLPDPEFGRLAAPPLRPDEVQAYLAGIGPADLATLARDPARGLYGQKALVVPALVDLLMGELGATRLVMVPQESTTGHILARLRR